MKNSSLILLYNNAEYLPFHLSSTTVFVNSWCSVVCILYGRKVALWILLGFKKVKIWHNWLLFVYRWAVRWKIRPSKKEIRNAIRRSYGRHGWMGKLFFLFWRLISVGVKLQTDTHALIVLFYSKRIYSMLKVKHPSDKRSVHPKEWTNRSPVLPILLYGIPQHYSNIPRLMQNIFMERIWVSNFICNFASNIKVL